MNKKRIATILLILAMLANLLTVSIAEDTIVDVNPSIDSVEEGPSVSSDLETAGASGEEVYTDDVDTEKAESNIEETDGNPAEASVEAPTQTEENGAADDTQDTAENAGENTDENISENSDSVSPDAIEPANTEDEAASVTEEETSVTEEETSVTEEETSATEEETSVTTTDHNDGPSDIMNHLAMIASEAAQTVAEDVEEDPVPEETAEEDEIVELTVEEKVFAVASQQLLPMLLTIEPQKRGEQLDGLAMLLVYRPNYSLG